MIRVAIVDDHEMVREGVRNMLEGEADFDVVGESATADDIVRFVAQTRPDILLLDARLPGVSGPEACRLLRIAHPQVGVVMLTVYSDEVLVQESIRAGARGYVLKDIERFDLCQSIRAVARGEAVVSTRVTGVLMDRMRSDTRSIGPAGGAGPLTEQQRQILRLVSEGNSNREIADVVHLSENTVKSHLQQIFARLGVRNRVEAAITAARDGLI
jgi:DNA-binding NarL/FixJ family response regulator